MMLAPWQQRVYAQAAAMLDQNRLPHALLFSGPARLGKRQVAEALARRALCLARERGEEACGQCRSCRLFDTRTQMRRSDEKGGKEVDMTETRPDGELAHPYGHTLHPDAHFIGFGWNEKVRPAKMRGEIVIEQIRHMAEKLALTAQYGERQVAIIDPADAINHAAANALLKTLEEPQPGRFIWLVSAHPARLPATIRSRTQVLAFHLPPRKEARDWLLQQHPDAAEADAALALAGGHPGLAQHWLAIGALTVRQAVLDDLQRLARHPGDAASVAERWAGDAHAALRLALAADAALAAARGAAPARVRALAAWFDQANAQRELLRSPVRHELALLELLLAWHALHRRQ